MMMTNIVYFEHRQILNGKYSYLSER